MISVLIPTLNEAERLPVLVDALRSDGIAHEIIVADGGSTDGTPDIAHAMECRVVTGARGRGPQLQAAAAVARGDILWFVHADTNAPPGALRAVRTTMETDPSAIGGNFRLVFDGDTDFARWLTGFYAWFRRRDLFYGDSGIFVRRDAFETIGGIKPMALMEDFDLSRRMIRNGRTVCIENPPLATSSRRFDGRHPVAIVTGWLIIHALYYAGVSPQRLARLYRSTRERRKVFRTTSSPRENAHRRS